jgi:hypothetical protein
METNVILFFSSVGMVMFLAIGGVIGWIYKETVDASIYAKSGGISHPEMLDQDGYLINEELYSVRFIDNELDDEDDY